MSINTIYNNMTNFRCNNTFKAFKNGNGLNLLTINYLKLTLNLCLIYNTCIYYLQLIWLKYISIKVLTFYLTYIVFITYSHHCFLHGLLYLPIIRFMEINPDMLSALFTLQLVSLMDLLILDSPSDLNVLLNFLC